MSTRPHRPNPPTARRPGGSVVGDACAAVDQFLAVQRWVARRLGAIDHERRVADVAAGLFDLTQGLHDLSPADRQLLRLAALAHDVGRSLGRDGHAAEGARLVLSDAALPLTPA